MTNDFWVRFVIENSIVVIVLALFAEGITRWTKNERIANLVWLVVLAKFLIPSFLFCELPWLPPEQPTRYSSVSIPGNQEFSNAEASSSMATPQVHPPITSNQLEPNTASTESNKRTLSSNKSIKSFGLKQYTNSISWTSVLGVLWLCGSLTWFGTLALRLNRFQLGLRASYPASDSLQALAKQIASKFRIAHVPEIRVVDEAISPILWNCGRNTQIFLPAHMIDDTSHDGMTAVLAHEMAHIRRLDHWVQRLAMLVLGLFWWHPVSWFAVKRLRQTQDVCCDLDVLEWDSDLQIAFVYALVGAATRVRTPAPTLTLAFLDPYSLQARVQRILQESNQAKLGVFKSWAILLVGFCLASVSARIVAQTPTKQETKSTKPLASSQTSKQEPETETDSAKTTQEVGSRAEIEVLEPDGSAAFKAKFIVGKQFDRFRLNAWLDAIPTRDSNLKFGETRRVDNGRLPLSFNPAEDFLAVWSEKGFFQIAISRLATVKSIQLQGWVTLEAELATRAGPDDGGTLSVSNHWTTDGQFRAMEISNETVVADKNGRAIVNRIAPGSIVIQTNVKEVRQGNVGWTEQDRSRTMLAEAGTTVKLAIGGKGRTVRGSLGFPQDDSIRDLESLWGDIEFLADKERIRIMIDQDGSFECEDVPFGPCRLTIRSRNRIGRAGDPTIYSATSFFECDSKETGILSIGTVLLKRDVTTSASEELKEKVSVSDDFQSTQKVSAVGTDKRENTFYTLFDNEGRLMRSLEKIEVPSGWVSVAKYVAFDIRHDRLYLLSAHDRITKAQTLVTLDLSGSILASRQLTPISSCRIAVNTKTGDLWLLKVDSIGKSKVYVFDLLGNQTKAYSVYAFNLCYSAVDDAFWFAGNTDVNKVDASSGESIASFKLPTGIWTCTDVIPDPNGGSICIEVNHPDMPKSANRIWRFDSNANQVGCVDVDKTRIQSVAFLDGEIWVSGIALDGNISGNYQISKSFMCFNTALEPIQDREFDFLYLAGEADGKSVWAISDKVLQKVTKDKDGRIQKTAVSTVPVEGALWASGN